MIILKICCSIFFTTLLIITQANRIFASMPIFDEDFDSYNTGDTPDTWSTVRSMQWNDYSLPCMYGSDTSKWIVTEDTTNNKLVKIAIKGPSCVIELKPNNFNIPDPSNYQIDLDMTFGNVHKHIQLMLGQIAKQLPKQYGVSSKALIGALTHQLQTYYSKGLIQTEIFQAINEELLSL